jgi:hypothetical protein
MSALKSYEILINEISSSSSIIIIFVVVVVIIIIIHAHCVINIDYHFCILFFLIIFVYFSIRASFVIGLWTVKFARK